MTISTRYGYQYRNIEKEWSKTFFILGTEILPNDEEKALKLIKQHIGNWILGTQIRLVRITETEVISISCV